MARMLELLAVLLSTLTGAILANTPNANGGTKVCPKVLSYKPLCPQQNQCSTHQNCRSTNQLCCPAENDCKMVCRTPYIIKKGNCHVPINLILVMDVSANLDTFQFNQAKRFAKTLIDNFDIGETLTNIALIAIYGPRRYKILVNFGSYTDPASSNAVRLKVEIDKLKKGIRGSDDLDNPLYSLVVNQALPRIRGARSSYAKVMLFIGTGNQANNARLVSAPRIRRNGVEIFALATGRFRISKLRELTNNPDRIFTPTTFNELQKAVKSIQQKQCTPPVCKYPIDFALVLDNSGSINEQEWDQVRQFALRIIETLGVSQAGNRVAVLTFNNRVTNVVDFDVFDVNTIRNRLNGIPVSRGQTFIDRALQELDRRIFIDTNSRPDALKACLILTDGVQTGNADLSVASQPLRDKQVSVFALGIGDEINESQLTKIVGGRQQHVYLSPTFAELASKVGALVKAQCPTICPLPLDLALVLDYSGSLNLKDWRSILDYASYLSYLYTFSDNDAHISVITFAKNAKLEIGFSAFTGRLTNEIVDRKIQKLYGIKEKNRYQKTRIDRALMLANSKVFTRSAGMRDNSLKVCVLITDGQQTTTKADSNRLSHLSQQLKNKGVHVFTLAVGTARHDRILKAMASQPTNRYALQSESFYSLGQFIELAQPRCPIVPTKDVSESVEPGQSSGDKPESQESSAPGKNDEDEDNGDDKENETQSQNVEV